jgi:hypothetical protein
MLVGKFEEAYFLKGGSSTLIKSILFEFAQLLSIPFSIPIGVANRIEKLKKDFPWGGVGDKFKFHLVSWSSICSPFFSGGLGDKNLIQLNCALLEKWLCCFATKKETYRDQ